MPYGYITCFYIYTYFQYLYRYIENMSYWNQYSMNNHLVHVSFVINTMTSNEDIQNIFWGPNGCKISISKPLPCLQAFWLRKRESNGAACYLGTLDDWKQGKTWSQITPINCKYRPCKTIYETPMSRNTLKSDITSYLIWLLHRQFLIQVIWHNPSSKCHQCKNAARIQSRNPPAKLIGAGVSVESLKVCGFFGLWILWTP